MPTRSAQAWGDLSSDTAQLDTEMALAEHETDFELCLNVGDAHGCKCIGRRRMNRKELRHASHVYIMDNEFNVCGIVEASAKRMHNQ